MGGPKVLLIWPQPGNILKKRKEGMESIVILGALLAIVIIGSNRSFLFLILLGAGGVWMYKALPQEDRMVVVKHYKKIKKRLIRAWDVLMHES